MQQGIRINQFVMGGFGVILVLTAITSFISKSATDSLIDSLTLLNHTYSVKFYLKEIEKNLVDAETGQRGFLITNKSEYLQPYNNAINKVKDNIKELSNKITDNEKQINNLDVVENSVQEKFQELAETISLKQSGKQQELLALILSDKGKRIMDVIREKLDEMLQIEEQLLEERQKQASQVQAFTNFMNLANFFCILIVSIIVSLVIIRILSFSLSRSLQSAFSIAERVSAGDLTTQIEVTTDDEIGRLMASLKNMIANLNLLVRQVQNSGILVTTSATQIAASGKQLEGTISEQVASTNEVTATAKEIAATSRGLVNTMEQVASMSQITRTAASSSQKDLLRMEVTMRQLSEATNAIASRLGVISEKANNINNIVVAITKVADQTNLLSLNAAIEAEKAGEYGLGFAVVAREIRRLADQTAIATVDIEQMVKQMQSSVSTGVMEMDKFATEVGRSVEDVVSISLQIGQIIQQVQDLTPHFESVNQGMETQSLGAQQISDAMVQLSSTSLQTADSLREINYAIAQLNQVAQGLRQEISRFQVKAESSISA
ncbi:MAG: methyl-accepting chemotaxis protein [Nostoc sp. EkiNYC01]|nr:CHASE3 domain-containing protein [Nostoc sp. EkiNYC01]